MQIFTCKKYPEFKIVAYSYETRNSWGHKATLIHNDTHELNTYKITYYNRTWECYRYQLVIKSILYDYMQSIIKEFINDYKKTYNIKRLSSTTKKYLTDQAMLGEFYQKLNTFYGEL